MRASAVVFGECGGADVLRVETVDVPDPGAGEVRIKVEAIGLNRSEALFREGWHPTKPDLPSRIGYEAAGTIESIGTGVSGFSVGDRVGTLPVMSLNERGAYGEMFTVPVDTIAPTPPELDAAEAASLWSSYITAYAALVELVKVQPGDLVLVTAASSSVGPAAIQILNMLGARPVGVTTKRAKAEAIRAMGAVDVIVTEDEDLTARVDTLTDGKGVPVVFDAIGGRSTAQLAEVMAPYGHYILYGVLDFEPGTLPAQALVEKNLTLHGFAMYLGDRPDRNARAIAFIADGVKQGKLRPLVGKRFPFSEIVDAARYLDSMAQIGKVVVTLDD